MIRILPVSLCFLLLFTFSLPSADAPKVTVLKTIETITIDGQIDPDEWQSVRAIRVSEDNGTDIAIDALTGASVIYDMYLVHDGVNLYLGFDVTDDIIVADTEDDISQDDTVQILMNADNEGIEREKNGEGFQLIIASDERTDSSDAIPFQFEAIKTDEGYSVEVSIPFSSFDTDSSDSKRALTAGDVIGFTAAVDDDDDGGPRDHQLWWHAVDVNAENDQTQWGLLEIFDNNVGIAHPVGRLTTMWGDMKRESEKKN